jgi:acyl-CoA synthetase (AMP-forming)/AMP-acid ligase II
VARLGERLRDTGVGHGDLVVVTARTTPAYVLCWLALASLGAVTVPTDPAGTLAELTGLLRQVEPRAIITDAALRPHVVEAGATLPLDVLDIDELLDDWTSESAVATSPSDTAVMPTTSLFSSPRPAPQASPSWSCRHTAPTRWQGWASRTGWS